MTRVRSLLIALLLISPFEVSGAEDPLEESHRLDNADLEAEVERRWGRIRRSDDVRVADGQRFFGYLECAVDVEIPPRWEYGLILNQLDDVEEHLAEIERQYETVSGFAISCGVPILDWESSDVGNGILGPANVTLNGDQMAMGESRFALPKPIIAKLHKGATIAIDKRGDHVAIAIHGDVADAFDLYTFSTEFGSSLRRIEVEALKQSLRGTKAIFGPLYHEVSIVQSADRIAVFGRSAHGDYCEVFDARSGKRIVRIQLQR